ncbi:MAG TPA: glycosyltransferase family 1 protein [Candidatus Methanoperedens sp.]|nr:glycosyltransferase family 1 protein [Candidatus Methanoperedens sp.]
MKHIVIDARLYGPKHTGLGRYTKNLLLSLKSLPDFNKYKFTLLVYPELRAEIEDDLGNNFNYLSTSLNHYSLKEQIFLPILLMKLKADLVHFTHLDKCIFYPKKSVVTIHDLIRHFSKGPNTSTKNPLLYWPKYWGYLLMTQVILKTSHIIVPSNFWRDYIIKKYHFDSKNIITTYEAVDPEFLSASLNAKTSSLRAERSNLSTSNYLIYTGNLYPHKNIDVVLKALRKLPSIKLKIICARSVFTNKIEKQIADCKLENQVEFLGYVPDSEFKKIYSGALALVHPSFLEGFSLTGLEAMALNCPVIAAKASCLPEIYEDSVLYFDPNDPSSLIKQIVTLQKSLKLRNKLIDLGHRQVSKYSWDKTAKKTLSFYQKIIN